MLRPKFARQSRRPPNLPERSKHPAPAALFLSAPPPPPTRAPPGACRHPLSCNEKLSDVQSLAVAAARSGYSSAPRKFLPTNTPCLLRCSLFRKEALRYFLPE